MEQLEDITSADNNEKGVIDEDNYQCSFVLSSLRAVSKATSGWMVALRPLFVHSQRSRVVASSITSFVLLGDMTFATVAKWP